MEGKKTVIGKFGKAIAPNNYYTACHILRKIPKQYRLNVINTFIICLK